MFQSVLSHSHINISTNIKKVAAKVQEKSSQLSARHRFTAQEAAVNRKEPGGAEIGTGAE